MTKQNVSGVKIVFFWLKFSKYGGYFDKYFADGFSLKTIKYEK